MKSIYKVGIICAIILLPTLFFPISSDISIYALGGKTIASGGKIYVDYLDLKPPGLYLAFAALYKVIGISPLSLRFFDFLMQSLTCALIFLILDKRFKDRKSGILAACVYAALYTALSFSQTLQAESFVGIGFSLIFILLSGKRTPTKSALTGLIAALLFSLKFTFGVVGAAAILYVLLDNQKDIKRSLFESGYIAFGAIIGALIGFFPLFDPVVFKDFKLILQYLDYYSSLNGFSYEFVRDSIKSVGEIFGDKISLLITFASIIGCALLLKMRLLASEQRRNEILFFFIAAALLFFSIIVERKFHYYHFLRLYPIISIFSGIGISYFLPHIKRQFADGNGIDKSITVILLGIAVVFSPVPRIIGLTIPAAQYFVDYDKYLNFYEKGDGVVIYKTQRAVASYLNKAVPEGSLAVVVSTGGGQINYFRQDKPHSKFAQSQFLMGELKIPKWQNEFEKELRRATYIAIQTNDAHPSITGIPDASYDWIRKSNFWAYIRDHYSETKRIGSFVILQHTAD
ncbi:MAG: ArnT family glycosyltransferase [Chloroflexota bacterium]